MDLNNDGHVDILSGSYSDLKIEGMAGLFQVLWGSADGFKKATPLKGTDDKPLIIGDTKNIRNFADRICTRPTAVDWDADGDLDLLVGNFKGTFSLFRGEGAGKFSPESEQLDISLKGAHSDPFCVDLDGDGDLDLLSGNADGGVQWAENTAGKGKEISLSSFKTLIKSENLGRVWNDEKITSGGSTRIWADDINGDGKLDLLMGDSSTISTPAKGTSRDEAKIAEKEWGTKMNAIQTRLQNPGSEDPEVIAKELSKHYGTRSKFLKEERTGFVWLYLGK